DGFRAGAGDDDANVVAVGEDGAQAAARREEAAEPPAAARVGAGVAPAAGVDDLDRRLVEAGAAAQGTHPAAQRASASTRSEPGSANAAQESATRPAVAVAASAAV